MKWLSGMFLVRAKVMLSVGFVLYMRLLRRYLLSEAVFIILLVLITCILIIITISHRIGA